jgi:hypothetical protein
MCFIFNGFHIFKFTAVFPVASTEGTLEGTQLRIEAFQLQKREII